MAKKAIVLLADGFEEVEAVTPVDYLRRAGVEVSTAAVGKSRTVTGSHGIPLAADALLEDLVKKGGWDAVILPGGMPGAKHLADSAAAGAFLRERAAAGALICAICAAPVVVLAPLGLLAGKRFTCYPGMESSVKEATKAWSPDPVVTDGETITSRGAGTAGRFAVAIIERLVSKSEGKKIAESVVLDL
jgi:4-methyl-5(b-hydroxyethyl)-thiazole monophosphate biosynthesis